MPLQQLPVSKIIAKKDVASTDTARQTTPPWTVPIDIVPADVAPADVVPFDVALIDVILSGGGEDLVASLGAHAHYPSLAAWMIWGRKAALKALKEYHRWGSTALWKECPLPNEPKLLFLLNKHPYSWTIGQFLLGSLSWLPLSTPFITTVIFLCP